MPDVAALIRNGDVSRSVVSGDQLTVSLKDKSAPFVSHKEEGVNLTTSLTKLGVTPEQLSTVELKVSPPSDMSGWLTILGTVLPLLLIGGLFLMIFCQPYIVAWMTELLELQPDEKVLKIGTGSGYQAAVLAELGFVDVYSIEIVPELADSAATRLQDLGYANVHVKQGDGYYGWPKYAPFDAIIVTAAPDHLPAPLAEQLTEDGRLVIPIGPPGGYQTLWKFVYQEGELKAYDMGGVAFVPFTGEGIRSEPAPGGPTP